MVYKNKICKLCEIEFVPTSGIQLYCSYNCCKKVNDEIHKLLEQKHPEYYKNIKKISSEKAYIKNKKKYGTYRPPRQYENDKYYHVITRYLIHRDYIFNKFRYNNKLPNKNYFCEIWRQRLDEMDSIFIEELTKSISKVADLELIINLLTNKIENQNNYFENKVKEE